MNASLTLRARALPRRISTHRQQQDGIKPRQLHPIRLLQLPRTRLLPAGAASTSAPIADDEPIERERDGVSRVTFERAGLETQFVAALATGGLLGFAVLSDELPALRLAVLTYALWAAGEWTVHRYFMHARKGSFGDRVSHLNDLHVTHHIDTEKNMTMRDGFVTDALYFHLPNSVLQVAFGSSVLFAANAALDLDIPCAWVPLAATLGMTVHNTLWNTLHMDMHEVPAEYDDGLPCLPFSRRGPFQAYIQWVYDNHTTHHDVGGSANYNIITPGPDFLLGTYYHRSRSVNL
eukprot:jgi/Tetstr1/422892/TSEL_013676.t1